VRRGGSGGCVGMFRVCLTVSQFILVRECLKVRFIRGLSIAVVLMRNVLCWRRLIENCNQKFT